MNRIRELRKQMDMTQKELSKHLKIADSTLSYWEMGKYEPDSEALKRLSKFFNVPIDYILGGDFIKWDISGSKAQYSDVDTSRLIGSHISVSEPGDAYSTHGKKDNYIDPATGDGQIGESEESSVPDASQPATPVNAINRSRGTKAAFDRIEFEGLTQGEIDLLAEYASFIKFRRKQE